MADRAPLAGPRLGHFLPYLLGQRLRAVAWPASGAERAAFLLVLGLMLGYGAGFGYLLNAGAQNPELAAALPKLVRLFNASVLLSALLVDFVPALRPVMRPVPEHFPVSARLSVATAFLLDLITLRRLTLLAALLALLLVAPRHAAVPGGALLLLAGVAAFSFNVRLLVALRRGRHPLMALHAANLGLLVAGLAFPEAPHHAALGGAAATLPWLLWAGQLYWLGPYFSACFLPAETSGTAAGPRLARLSPEWQAYARRAWLPLLVGAALKTVLLAVASFLPEPTSQGTGFSSAFFLYLALPPALGFSYVNNNLFGYLRPLVANELLRLGLTRRVLGLYLRLVGPVVLADCLLSAGLLLALFPVAKWPLLGLLPLGAAAFTSVGLWGSLYQAKPVPDNVNFANLRNHSSKLVGLCTVGLGALLYFLPWWWLRGLVAALVAGLAAWPVRAVLRNDGNLRRRLWRGIGA